MKTLSAVAVTVLAFCGPAFGLMLDLTSAGASGEINGALFVQIDPQSTGTGLIESFVETFGAGVTHAYNTTVSGVLDNGSSAQFNHELLIADVPVVPDTTDVLLEFLLDINQIGPSPFLSLDEVQIFRSSTPNQSVTTFGADGLLQLADASLVYRMDTALADNWVWLDYSLNAGSGSGDMLLYVPSALFAAAGTGEYVYLYSRFGENYAANDGFEEWAVRTTTEVIPEPATVVLMMTGLAGIFGFKKKRQP